MRRVADVFSKKKRSQVMAAIRSKGNKDTELKLASILRTHRIKGWRRHQSLPGKPDFVFRRELLAVFVDGCFWHGCPKHSRLPRSNQYYWSRKLERNRERDRKITRKLRKIGWHVVRVWEHQLANEQRVVRRVVTMLAKPKRDENNPRTVPTTKSR